MSEREQVVDQLWRRMIQANGVIVAKIGEKLPGLYKIRLTKEEQESQAQVWREAARDMLTIIEEAGYALPQKGDLRAQLLSAARQMKARSFSRGYSDPDNVDSRAEEARADAIADVGQMLFDALMEGQ